MKLEVGKSYKNHSGEIVRIVCFHSYNTFPFFDEKERCYTEEGLYLHEEQSSLDLLEEIQDDIIENDANEKEDFTDTLDAFRFRALSLFESIHQLLSSNINYYLHMINISGVMRLDDYNELLEARNVILKKGVEIRETLRKKR